MCIYFKQIWDSLNRVLMSASSPPCRKHFLMIPMFVEVMVLLTAQGHTHSTAFLIYSVASLAMGF